MDGFNSAFYEINEIIYGYRINKTVNDYRNPLGLVSIVIGWITLCIELPVLCWACFVLYHQVKGNHVSPVYLINLLISDLLQLIGRPGYMILVLDFSPSITIALLYIFDCGITASIGFMLCIALERYLVVVHPLWYRFHRTIKHSILISLAVWVSSVPLSVLSYMLLFYLHEDKTHNLLFFIISLLPIPLLVFFLVGTWRPLSRSISVPVKEKKRFLGTLVLVLANYIVLILPRVLFSFIISVSSEDRPRLYVIFNNITMMLLYISPLMDCLLYIFLKNEASYTPKVPACCWKLIGRQEHSETSTVQTGDVTHV